MADDMATNSSGAGSTLLAALSRSDAWPDAGGARVEVIQTHISMLFFVGDRVYKVKKAVDMGFLDYSTLQARERFCHEEVRLNRRLAPDVYLGVRPITRDGDGTIRLDGAGATIDYAVEMERLPADRMLDTLLKRNEVSEREIDDLVERLAEFHSSCATGAGVDEHATPDDLRTQEIDNLDGLRPFAGRGGIVPTHSLQTLGAAMLAFIDRRRELLERRVAEGRIREGHGDLHAGNICLRDGDFVMYDCIEFTRRFRCRDVGAELAYLAMDFDRLGRRNLGRRLLAQYANRTTDPTLEDVARFYKAHFAIIRGKVLALKSAEEEVLESDRARAIEEATAFLQLAVGYIILPCLIVLCGLPGSGKSHLASSLTWALGAELIRSDVVRKRLAGLEPGARPSETNRNALYTPEMTRRVYAHMRATARQSITDRSRIPILDATHSSVEERARARQLATELGVEAILIETRCAEAIIRDRLEARRLERDEPSDADWAIYLEARDRFEPTDDWPGDARLVCSTDEMESAEMTTHALAMLAQQTRAADGRALDRTSERYQ